MLLQGSVTSASAVAASSFWAMAMKTSRRASFSAGSPSVRMATSAFTRSIPFATSSFTPKASAASRIPLVFGFLSARMRKSSEFPCGRLPRKYRLAPTCAPSWKAAAASSLVPCGEQAVDHFAAALRVDVAAVAAAGADGGRLVHEPDARLEAEVAVEERPHRADVHGVAAVLAVQGLAGEGGDQRVRASVDDGQLRLLGDLVHEAHAAGAHDAALGVVDHLRPEDLALGLVQLVDADARGLVVVLHVVILEIA